MDLNWPFIIGALVVIAIIIARTALQPRYARRKTLEAMQYDINDANAWVCDVIKSDKDDSVRLYWLMNISPFYLTKENLKAYYTEVARLAEEHADHLLQKAQRDHDTAALMQLCDFVKLRKAREVPTEPLWFLRSFEFDKEVFKANTNLAETRLWARETTDYTRLTKRAYRYPDGWNDLVARLIPNPSLDQFDTGDTVWLNGDYIINGIKALETKSLTLAKLVLAYANKSPAVAAELRDVRTQLVRFVVAYEKQQQPTGEHPSTP